MLCHFISYKSRKKTCIIRSLLTFRFHAMLCEHWISLSLKYFCSKKTCILFIDGFLPGDTMLPRYMLWPCVCPSIWQSVTSRYCIETTRMIELFFLALKLLLTYLKLYYKKIWIPPKIRVLSSGSLLQTLYLENFAMASQWCDSEACELHI